MSLLRSLEYQQLVHVYTLGDYGSQGLGNSYHTCNARHCTCR